MRCGRMLGLSAVAAYALRSIVRNVCDDVDHCTAHLIHHVEHSAALIFCSSMLLYSDACLVCVSAYFYTPNH